MDSTMICQQCVDQLADFAGLKFSVAADTERAMRAEDAHVLEKSNLDIEAGVRAAIAIVDAVRAAR
jgi:phosphoserine phosphatase